MDLKTRAFVAACCLGLAFAMLGVHFVFTRREDRNRGALIVAGTAIGTAVVVMFSPALACMSFAVAGVLLFSEGVRVRRAAAADSDLVS